MDETRDTTDGTDSYDSRDVERGVAWAMVESSPDGMLLVDEQGRVLLANRAIETMFGRDRKSVV